MFNCMLKNILGVGCLLFGVVFLSAQNNTNWKVGIATKDVTPTQSMWLGGYASRNHPSEGIRQKIWIKAVALEDALGNQGVMVSMDLISIPKDLSDKVRHRLAKDYLLNRSQILLNISHTHTGPEIRPLAWNMEAAEKQKIENYVQYLEDEIVALVGAALAKKERASLSVGQGITRFQVNRRNNQERLLRSYTELKGPNDYAVPVIAVRDEGGALRAVLFSYACHPTVLSDYQFSGDYPGYAQEALESLYPGVTAMFFQGAGGDQNPLPRRKPELAEQYGETLAAAVKRVLQSEMEILPASLAMSYAEIPIGMQEGPPCAEDLQQIVSDTISQPGYLRHRAQVLLDRLNSKEGLKKDYPYPVQVWNIGNQPLFALGGELLIGYAIELKRIFGDHVIILGYSNDVMGYIPTVTVLREGGYEGNRSPYFTNPWEANIEYLIIDQAQKLAKEIGIKKFQ